MLQKSTTIFTDAELVAKYKENGDLNDLGFLYKRYISLVYGVSLKYLKNPDDSQDVVMQIFEKLIDKLMEHDVRNFKSWLHVLTKNHCLMWLRDSKSKSGLTVNIDTIVVENQPFLHHEEEEELEDNLIKLEKCIKKLELKQKECVELFFIQKKCYNEIVNMTKHELKKVKSYIQNGKRNLKICMDENG